MMKVRGYRVLVKADEIETVSRGGIVIVQDEKLEKAAQQTGIVVGVGHTCWYDEDPWCKVGDRILFAKYAGRLIVDPDTGEDYMVMNDKDVIIVIEGET